MNKAELVELVAERGEFTKRDTELVLNELLQAIQDTVASGGEVRLVNFGTFRPAFRQARDGRNPQTGESMKISAQTVPVFRPGKEFKDLVARR